MIVVRQAERPYTAEDLAEMPEDGRRYEVIGGELIVSPSPSERHQRCLLRLTLKIASYVEEDERGVLYLAPFDVHLGLYDVLQPDLMFVGRDHLDRIKQRGIEGGPDLVIEIISPSSSGIDRVRKSATYATFGISEYWIVDPKTETILAQELRDGGYQPIPPRDGLIRSKVLDGLIIDPREIFATPDWMPEAVE